MQVSSFTCNIKLYINFKSVGNKLRKKKKKKKKKNCDKNFRLTTHYQDINVKVLNVQFK